MNQLARMKIFSILLVMLLGTLLIACCTSAPAQKTATTTTPTLQVTASTAEPHISGTIKQLEVRRGEDALFTGFVQGDAKSFTITTYYLCVTDAPNCPNPKSLYNTAGFTDKKVVPINADATFSSSMGTSAYKQGTYVAFLELPTGQYTSIMFIIT